MAELPAERPVAERTVESLSLPLRCLCVEEWWWLCESRRVFCKLRRTVERDLFVLLSGVEVELLLVGAGAAPAPSTFILRVEVTGSGEKVARARRAISGSIWIEDEARGRGVAVSRVSSLEVV